VFDQVFELWCAGLDRLLEGLDRGLVEELRAQGLLDPDSIEMLSLTLQRLLPGLSPLGRAALAGDRAGLLRLLRGAALQLGLPGVPSAAQAGFVGRRLLAAAGGGALRGDQDALLAALRERGLGPAGLVVVAGGLDAALRRVEEAARRVAAREAEARGVAAAGSLLGAGGPPTADERRRAEAAVRRLAERLKARLVRRDRGRGPGPLALRRTLRRSLALGGVPARPAFRPRRPRRPDVMVLCDVSESVRPTTRLMLLFVYTLQALFHRVRTFVFVADLAEVTAALRAERDPARAADLAVAARAVSLAANSNYGRVLRTFHREHLRAVTRRTTVLIVGDGRSNYLPPEAWALEELRRRARRVLWICPEPRAAWGSGDSELLLYARSCDRVAPVTTLEELEGVAGALV
jgi:hypothetical protein